jgi:DNA-binding transcriptional LysR family regulator
MSNAHIATLDFQSLLVFEALMQNRQVTRAAASLDISQPTFSRRLSKMRERFDDPLFVRTQHSMEPTPYALAIAEAVSEIVELYHSSFTGVGHFDAKTSQRNFRVAASDIGHSILFPRLLKLVKTAAPSVKLTAANLGEKPLIDVLEKGNADLAFGSFPKLNAGIYEQTIYTDEYACLVSSENKKYKNRISRKEYAEAKHVVVSLEGLDHAHHEAERTIRNAVAPDNVVVVAQSFMTALALAQNSDLMLTLPLRSAAIFNLQKKFRLLELPFTLPPFRVRQYWHERFHKDPANRWLRNHIADLFQK